MPTFGTASNPANYVEVPDPLIPGQVKRPEAGTVLKARTYPDGVELGDIVVGDYGYWDAVYDTDAISVSGDGGVNWIGPLFSVEALTATISGGLNADLALSRATEALAVAQDAGSDAATATWISEGVQTQSAGDARWSRKAFGLLNVKESFGAVGNGVTDDSAAFEQANAAANAGYTRGIYIPNGTYLSSFSPTAKTIVGENRQKTIFKYTGTGAALGPIPGQINYHRRVENLTILGLGAGSSAVGIDLDTSPSGRYQNLIVSGFTVGLNFASTMGLSSPLYNVFDDVTVQSCTTGVLMDGIANSNRFNNFRVNQATVGFDIVVGGQNVIHGGAIENVTTGAIVRGNPLNRANVFEATRFEFASAAHYQVDAGAEMTAFMACRFIGGTKVDNGKWTVDVDLATGTYRGRGLALRNNDATDSTASLTIVNQGTGDAIQADGGFAVTKAGHVKTPQIYNPAGFANARMQLNSSGTVLDRNVGDNATTLRVNQVHASATGSIQEWQAQSVTKARVTRAGHVVISTNAAPADGDLIAGELAFWFDSTNGAARLMVKAKQADGTVRTGSVNLA